MGKREKQGREKNGEKRKKYKKGFKQRKISTEKEKNGEKRKWKK